MPMKHVVEDGHDHEQERVKREDHVCRNREGVDMNLGFHPVAERGAEEADEAGDHRLSPV